MRSGTTQYVTGSKATIYWREIGAGQAIIDLSAYNYSKVLAIYSVITMNGYGTGDTLGIIQDDDTLAILRPRSSWNFTPNVDNTNKTITITAQYWDVPQAGGPWNWYILLG